MGHTLHTEIEIDASAADVWKVLTDLESYEEWNPFIVSAAGTVAVGERLTNRMQPPGGKAMTFRPKVTEAEEGRVFEWLGRPLVPGIFDGRHRFELESLAGDRTLLRHSEHFRGILVPFMRKSLDTKALAGFRAMNDALAKRVEAQRSA
jgi:hypothetical protein